MRPQFEVALRGEDIGRAVGVELVRVLEIRDAANMEPLFRWCPYTMLFASEKSAAFAADRKMDRTWRPMFAGR